VPGISLVKEFDAIADEAAKERLLRRAESLSA
jgi:hypothetical protein